MQLGMKGMTIMVTGSAGFIGFHVTKRLLELGESVVGIDNVNAYYDPSLKEARMREIEKMVKPEGVEYKMEKADIIDNTKMEKIFREYKPSTVVNLAAQAGVRYSIDNPSEYIQSNLVGFGNIIENCRKLKVRNLIYASSSSVYGGNKNLPFSETHGVDHPVSLYAASKRANELIAHSYSHLYGLPTTGLRFFTVYGPWGRPDMALFLFTKAILEGEPIKVFNKGDMVRDFTFIDDVVESIIRLIGKPAEASTIYDPYKPEPGKSWCPFQIFNVGNSNPIPLMQYIEELELALGSKAIKRMMPLQDGDVPVTAADASALEAWIQFKPETSVKEGVKKFVDWYREFYNV